MVQNSNRYACEVWTMGSTRYKPLRTMEEPSLNRRKRSCKFGNSESNKQAAGRMLFRTAGWLACLETCRAGWRLDPGGMECRRIDPDSRYTENWNSTIACLSRSLPTCLLALSPTLSTPLQFSLVILSLVGYRSVAWAKWLHGTQPPLEKLMRTVKLSRNFILRNPKALIRIF
jgi:hypothetical protein